MTCLPMAGFLRSAPEGKGEHHTTLRLMTPWTGSGVESYGVDSGPIQRGLGGGGWGRVLEQGPGGVRCVLEEFTPSLRLSFVPGVRSRRGRVMVFTVGEEEEIIRGRRAYGKILLMI